MSSKNAPRFFSSVDSSRYKTALNSCLKIASDASLNFTCQPTSFQKFNAIKNAQCSISSICLLENTTNLDENSGCDVNVRLSQDCQKLSADETDKNIDKIYESEVNSELKSIFQSLDIIDMMYQDHEQRDKDFEEQNENYRKYLLDEAHEVISTESVSEKLLRIQNFNTRLSKIIKDASNLKQKLRNPKLNDVWNVNISSHRFIVGFFELAKKMINELETNLNSIKWNCKCNLEENLDMESSVAKISSAVNDIEKELDTLIEMRSTLQHFEAALKNQNHKV